MIVLEAGGVVRTYIGGDGGRITVLNGVDLQVAQGEMVAIIGASGAGKSTLLHILGALDQPTAGWVAVAGQRVASGANAALAGEVRRPTDEAVRAETDRDVSSLRNRSIGFVFQFHHLLREFNALENVMMPLWIAGRNAAAAESRARELLDLVGLGSNALRLRGRSRRRRRFCCWTNHQAISIMRTASGCTICWPDSPATSTLPWWW